MNEVMIGKWNDRVKGTDTVYIVGDMFFRCSDAETILKRLKGKKRLVIGNHDSSWINKVGYPNKLHFCKLIREHPEVIE